MKYKVVSLHGDRSALVAILAKASFTDYEETSQKPQMRILSEYFDEISPKVMVVEYDYIDSNYLDDFSVYHAKCFKNYKKKTVRILFFDQHFDQKNLDDYISVGVASNTCLGKLLSESYLGFIVVRPLPRRMIGRTALKTYCETPKSGSKEPYKRYYPTSKLIESCLFGISLKVNSLPFQEQDNAVSACATSALWSVMNKTASLFNHPVLSPSQITQIATDGLPMATGRDFPNEGLTSEQMMSALKHVGLEPHCVDFTSDSIGSALGSPGFVSDSMSTSVSVESDKLLKEYLYAYLRCGIPLILGLDLYRKDRNLSPNVSWYHWGRHAVAVAGYGLLDNKDSVNEMPFIAHRINKIYAHDDQLGPYSRMTFRLDSEQLGFYTAKISFDTSWNSDDHEYRAVPNLLIVPLYHKVRISYLDIRKVIVDFHLSMKELLPEFCYNQGIRDKYNCSVWDISLDCLKEYKRKILALTDVFSPSERRHILTSSLPRFIWRCSLVHNNQPILDLLFDATDVCSGNLFVQAVAFDHDCSKAIISASAMAYNFHRAKDPLLHQLFKSLEKVYNKRFK